VIVASENCAIGDMRSPVGLNLDPAPSGHADGQNNNRARA